ncbi:MAG: SIMPL domain-containing protein [Acidimicrobiales bacterium]
MSDHFDAAPSQPSSEDSARRGYPRHFVVRMVFLLAFAVVIAAISFVGESLGHNHSSSAATISVTGSGTVSGAPNTMSFQIGVQTVAANAASALSENNAKMRALEASLQRNGVTKKNMQTTGLNVYQNTNNSGAVTGYTVQDNINVTLHHLQRAGAVLDAAANTVGNDIQLSGVTFSISNQSSLLAKARAAAMRNAHTEAAQIAKGGATTVGQIVRVTDEENTGSTDIVFPFATAMAKAARSVPIESGSQTVNVQVEVVYSLAD